MANTLATRKQSEAIRKQMQVIRNALPRDVDAARLQAHELTDWRHHMRKNPWPILAATAAAAYMVVPSKSPRPTIVHVDGGKGNREWSQADEPAPKKSLISGAAGALFAMALRSGMSLATRQLSQAFLSNGNRFPQAHSSNS